MQTAEALRREHAHGGITAREADQRERLLQGVLHLRVALFRDRCLDDRRRTRLGLVSELHRGAPPRLSVRARQLRACFVGFEERFDGDTQAAVGGDLRQARDRHGAERLLVIRCGDLDDILIALRGLRPRHDDLDRLALGARVHVALAQRREELEPLRVLGASDDRDRCLALVGIVDREVGQRLERLGGLRVARRRNGEPRDEQQQQQSLHQAFSGVLTPSRASSRLHGRPYAFF